MDTNLWVSTSQLLVQNPLKIHTVGGSTVYAITSGSFPLTWGTLLTTLDTSFNATLRIRTLVSLLVHFTFEYMCIYMCSLNNSHTTNFDSILTLLGHTLSPLLSDFCSTFNHTVSSYYSPFELQPLGSSQFFPDCSINTLFHNSLKHLKTTLQTTTPVQQGNTSSKRTTQLMPLHYFLITS